MSCSQVSKNFRGHMISYRAEADCGCSEGDEATLTAVALSAVAEVGNQVVDECGYLVVLPLCIQLTNKLLYFQCTHFPLLVQLVTKIPLRTRLNWRLDAGLIGLRILPVFTRHDLAIKRVGEGQGGLAGSVCVSALASAAI